MRKGFKQIIAVGMSISMLTSILILGDTFVRVNPVTAIENNVYEGTFSATASWKIDEQGLLTISGTGAVSGHSKFKKYDVKKLVVESGITSIDSDMFRDSTMLESAILPDTLETIGDYAFEGCVSLKSIEVSDDNQYFQTEDGVLYDKDVKTLIVYPAAKEAQHYEIPQGVTSIKEYAFDYIRGLENIVIPESVKSFGNYTPFYKASSIVSFYVDSNNAYFSSIDGDLYSKDGTKIIRHAMRSEISSINIQDKVEHIADEAFAGTNALTEIIVGADVKEIGDGAFNDCKNLASITIQNPNCKLDELIQKSLSDYNKELVMNGYEDSTAEKCAIKYGWNFHAITEEAVSSISIYSMPKKTVFALNDKFNSVGLEIMVNYADGTRVIRNSGFTIAGFNAEELGTQEITVNYKGASTQYEVEIVTQLEHEKADLGERTTVDIIEENQLYYLEFIPDITGIYDFYALSSSDTYGAIYDEEGNLLAENDDKGDTENEEYVIDFYISYNMEAGKKYLLAVKFQVQDEIGSFDVIVKRHDQPGVEETTIQETVTAEESLETTTTGMIKPSETTMTGAQKPSETETNILETTKPESSAKISIKKTTVKKATKKKTSKNAKISLKKITGVNGYEVRISTSKKFKKSQTVTKKFKKSAFVFKSNKIKGKKTLYIQARAYKKVDGKVYYSSWSNKKKIKINK